jgi:hypothetical protein
MEDTEEQVPKTKEEKIIEKTLVYHGTTPEFFENIITEKIEPGHSLYTKEGKRFGNEIGFSVTTDKAEANEYGKAIVFELSPTAKIAMPEDFPQVFKRYPDGMDFNQLEAAKLAKKAGFDGINIGAFEKSIFEEPTTNEIRIFNPKVLKILTPKEGLK